MTAGVWARQPETLYIREVMVQVHPRGFRVRSLMVITTLLDARLYSSSDLAAACYARWNIEMDMRSIKPVMEMDVLRCKTPEMVRQEIWMHLLAYNLVRTLAAEAATQVDMDPRKISFKGTLQTLTAFTAVGWAGFPTDPKRFYAAILRTVASHRVGNLPDRIEPRAIKRRPKDQDCLNQPRAIARNRLMKGS